MGRKKQEKVEKAEAEKKTDGRRDKGVQAKKGWLYILLPQRKVEEGQKVSSKRWVATGLADTDKNVGKAVDMRKSRMSSKNKGLTDDSNVMFVMYVDLYLARKKRTVVDTTYAGYLYRSVKIKEFFRKLKLKDITQADVEQFLDHLFSADKCQMRTVKDIKVLFNGIMEQAVKDGLIADNPVKDAMINKSLALRNAKVKDDDDFFSYREAQLFLERVESHKLYELFFVTLFFGLRREEVLGLRWSSVDFKAKTLRVNHTVTVGTRVNRLNSTKTDTSNRTYPLTDDQVKMFEHLKKEEIKNRELFGEAYKDNDYIFKNEDGSLHYPDYPSKQFKKVIKENPDLPQRTKFHGLRTSCVSILVHENFDVKGIQKWVGHKDINTTLKIYAKVKEKEAKEEILHGMTSIIRPKSYD